MNDKQFKTKFASLLAIAGVGLVLAIAFLLLYFGPFHDIRLLLGAIALLLVSVVSNTSILVMALKRLKEQRQKKNNHKIS
ncbi:MAG: hypothetical protein J6X81_03800 [Muribaculaceae bacterium]|nr:hypothetical protein [Muribaculaceae bacterium]